MTRKLQDSSDERGERSKRDSDRLQIRREWAMPSDKTFTIDPIRKLVLEEVRSSNGLWIDPFAGRTGVPGVDVTNDVNPDIDTDYTERATEFLSRFEESEVDGGILLDPPYSPRQIKESYDGAGIEVSREDTQSSWWSEIKQAVRRVTATGATVVTCGWQSDGVGLTTREILLVSHGAWHNDTIVVVEDRQQTRLDTQTKIPATDGGESPALEDTEGEQ